MSNNDDLFNKLNNIVDQNFVDEYKINVKTRLHYYRKKYNKRNNYPSKIKHKILKQNLILN